MKPIITQKVAPAIETIKKSLPHALLIAGSEGVGLFTIANYIADEQHVLRLIHPELLTKTSTIPQISIEAIRELYVDTRGKSLKNTIVIIDDADKMTHAAQNSFLKLLEEPNDNTYFILTSHNPTKLLPTVRSRVQSHYIPPLTDEETATYLDTLSKIDDRKRTQLNFIAAGLPAELTRLISDETYFKQVSERVVLARSLLEGEKDERLMAIMSSKVDRVEALRLIKMMVRLLSRHPSPHSTELTLELLDCYDTIERGGNLKLQLASAMV